VRLKGGDPFVLGRGGEEALALQEAGVRFDVVPGVSSAVAAAALAGIPVTHRGVAPGFLTVSGHDEEAFAQAIDGVPHGRVTLVILMGMKRRTALAGVLLAQGWPGQVPVAVVADASLPAQVVWRGTIADLGADSAEIAGDSPAVIVVGRVAAFDLRDAAAQAAEVEKTGAMRASQG
jgi:uroporphyrin-III C-methyltransferase/precorrin-2 dehydrogenase/sirohydrochlorin ferrochelatase